MKFSFLCVSTIAGAFILGLPSVGFAQLDVSQRYCPNPATDFFKESIYHESGEPWIETIVDPDWERTFLRGERKIVGDIPLTPVYDLVVRIKPEFNYYCIPGWVDGGVQVTAEQLPASLPLKGYISDDSQYDTRYPSLFDKLVGPGGFVRTSDKDEQGRFIYEWKIKGWPNGIVRGSQLKTLVYKIQRKVPIKVVIEI